MCHQDACTIGQKIASITILLIFSAMAFQWFPHDTSTRAQKVTLIAFVWLFSNVRWLPWLLRLWREKRTGFTFNKNAWSDQMLLCLAPAFFVAWGSHPRPVWGFTCLAGARKNDFPFFFMFSTDEIYDTVLILCCCSTSVFRGDIKLYHWVSKGQCFSK